MKLMIVDDEVFVRDGIKQAFNWEEEDIEIVAEASDGQSALTKAVQAKPDIIICDIRMPKLDGISFAKQIKEMLPDVRIIMLTAFAEKEYMLEAIRSDISDFLLKPAGLDQIRKTVTRVREDIQRERSGRMLLEQRGELLEENAALFYDHYLSGLLEGRITVDKTREAIRLLDIPLDGPFYAIVLFKPVEGRKWLVVQLLCGSLPAWKPVVAEIDGHMVVILSLEKEGDIAEIKERLDAREQELTDSHAGALLLTAPVKSLGLLAGAYASAKEIFARCVWQRDGSVETVDSLHLPPVDAQGTRAITQRLFRAFDERTETRAAAAECYDRIAEMKLSLHAFTECMEEIAHQYFVRFGVSLDKLSGMVDRDSFVSQLCQRGEEAIDYGMGHTGRALRYIHSHYTQNIQLEDVAKALFLSPTYVSRILNEKGSRGFVGWLRYFRIARAKELMTDSPGKNYEISEQVGYKSYKVFSEHFQKETGQTISEWRSARK